SNGSAGGGNVTNNDNENQNGNSGNQNGNGGNSNNSNVNDNDNSNPGGPARALVAAIHRPSAFSAVKVFRLHSDGAIEDLDQRLFGANTPRAIAMRPDGREALVAWGTLRGVHGVTVYRFDADGANATHDEPLELGSEREPVAVTYVSDLLAIVARVDAVDGGAPNELVALVRNTPEQPFVVAQSTSVVTNWPLSVAPDGTGGALVLRGEPDGAGTSEVLRLNYDAASGWLAAGAPQTLSPRAQQLAGAGQRSYTVTPDPADPLSPSRLTPGGQFYGFTAGAPGLSADPVLTVPAFGDALAVDPAGEFAVVAARSFELGPTGEPISRAIRWLTVELQNGVAVSSSLGPSSEPALRMRAMVLTSDGILVTALERFQNQAAGPLEVYPLSTWRREGSDWVPRATPVYLEGYSMIAVGP
ncbi:MAG: hypothetical protein AAFY60_05765, partial [Myxococcota bacterium]